MLDDFDIPGLQDLFDLLGDLANLIDLGGDDLAGLDEPVLWLWPDAGGVVDVTSPEAFWSGLAAEPLDVDGFAAEFGNMQFHNPFSSPIEDGSYDDLVARTAATTGLSVSDFPN